MLRSMLPAAFLAALALPLPGLAFEATISARYHGQVDGRFENTTPPGGYCARWPTFCKESFTAWLPITYKKTTVRYAPNIRDRLYLKLPARRVVSVEDVASGRRYDVTFEFTGVSQSLVRLSAGGVPIGSINGGCTQNIASTSTDYSRGEFLWRLRNPQMPEFCYADNSLLAYKEPVLSEIIEMGISYNLIMPRPIGMVQGLYRGSVHYTIGPNGDFDFGDGVSDLGANQLTLNFELEVRHDLYLNFPPGNDRAVLEPPGGWMAWLGGRGAPNRLYRDLPFSLWTTGPIKVYKHCQFNVDQRCGIENAAGHRVPVEVAVTLPGGLNDAATGRTITRQPVPTGEATAMLIDVQNAVANQAAKLHFEVAKEDIGGMLNHAGQTYQGQVTLLFDAQM